MTTKNAPVDKARQQVIAKIDTVMKAVDEGFKVFGPERDKTESAGEVKAFKAKVDAAKRDPSPAATKTLAALVKTGEALVKTMEKRGARASGTTAASSSRTRSAPRSPAPCSRSAGSPIRR